MPHANSAIYLPSPEDLEKITSDSNYIILEKIDPSGTQKFFNFEYGLSSGNFHNVKKNLLKQKDSHVNTTLGP